MRHALKLSWERHEQARTCHADRPAYSKNGAWIDCSHGLEHRHNVPHASSAEGSAYRADSDPGVHDTPSPPFLSTAFFWEKLTAWLTVQLHIAKPCKGVSLHSAHALQVASLAQDLCLGGETAPSTSVLDKTARAAPRPRR